MADLATRAGVEGAPAHASTRRCSASPRRRSSRVGSRSGLDFGITSTLLRPRRRTAPPAADCEACLLRLKGFEEAGRARSGEVPGRARMSYAVKEIFYTLQGEGANAGRPAVFCRFAGCNLWTRPRGGPGRRGLPVLRHRFRGDRRPGRRQVRRRPTTLAAAVAAAWPAGDPAARPLVVCTGGEPLLQLDPPLIEALHAAGFEIAVETNGTRRAAGGHRLALREPQGRGAAWWCARATSSSWSIRRRAPSRSGTRRSAFRHFFLQPMDGPAREAQHRAPRSRIASRIRAGD